MEQKRTGLSYVFTLAKEERGKLSLGMLLAVFSSALSFVPYLVVYQILLLIIKQEVTLPAMLGWAGIGIAAAVLQAILTSFAGICSHTAAFNTMHRIKVRVLEHESGEDYLEAVLMLQKKNGMVRSVDLARHMEVSKPSVCHAVATLRDGGFLTMDEDHFLQLTDVGREVAEKIYERHCFFTEQLIAAGVDPRTAEADACRIEHIISDESFSRLKEAAEQEQT